ncbi:MAG: 5'/3'-nucleotidase SurE [Deltaproteobacteria bacterium]|jgi:5'-nucleotidase|nr:5'/3'-nucleotidase SurE [Deltaproteobacteria bacterium]
MSVRILLTNDDGIMAEGLNAAYLALKADGHDVVVSAPSGERSGSSHAVTLWRPIIVKKVLMPSGAYGQSVSGSPADASRMGFMLLNEPKIDLVISGVNNDTNLAYDVNYSGTVGAALEATVAGFPAVAISVEKELPYDWDRVGKIVCRVADLYKGWDIPEGVTLNVNIPQKISADEFFWVSPHHATPYDYLEQKRLDSETIECVRYREKSERLHPQETDVWHLTQGHITISPLIPVGAHLATLTRLSGKDPGAFPGA